MDWELKKKKIEEILGISLDHTKEELQQEEKIIEFTQILQLGKKYHSQKNYPEALQQYEEALQLALHYTKIYKKIPFYQDNKIVLRCILAIGDVHCDQKKYDDAIREYEKALNIIAEGGLSDTEMSKEAEELFRERIDLMKMGQIFKLGENYLNQGNYSEALKQFEEGLQLNEQLGDLRRKPHILEIIGAIYKEQKNYPEARKRYEEARQIYEQINDFSENLRVSELINSINRITVRSDRTKIEVKAFLDSLRAPQEDSKPCISCGELVSISNEYCGHCGANQKEKSIENLATQDVKPCIKCGKNIPISDGFCTFCGASQEEKKVEAVSFPDVKPCIKCGKQISKSIKFCTYCGTKQELEKLIQ